MPISIRTMIFVILIIVLVEITQSTKINFDSNAVPIELDEMIIKKRRLSCDDEEMVKLESIQLRKIPQDLIKSNVIRSISLKNNIINEIPDGVFDNVPNLQCLDLSYNRIPISELLHFKHDRLNTLILDYQKPIELLDITSITTYVRFPNLESLSLKGIDHKHFLLYSDLFPNLSTIYWNNNQLNYVDQNLADYFSPQLKIVHLERNKFQNLTIKNLKNVEELYLDENPLETFNIENDKNLKVISLANCQLGNDWHFWISNLITLDLSGNRITDIIMDEKLDAYNTLDLEHLSLSRNLFTNIPHLEKLHRLKTLSLSYNLIETIDQVIVSDTLKTLNLRGNRLNYIHPVAFSAVPILEQLDISENQLDSLPLEWGRNLNTLRYLNLRSNKFKIILMTNIYPISNLNEVFVGNNLFKTINEEEIEYLPKNCTVYVI